MKTIVFPERHHEKAIEIMERAKKQLEALGYAAGYTFKLNYEETPPNAGYAFLQINLVASIMC